ncbi:MAG: alpha/beta hydrolase [Crocinitomicaceae bacterium]|nr:alpha/beta hydrolase [Crocinitomicaceae bacterium]
MLESKKIKIDQLEFDCIISGNEADELVILLHGFPESSYVFRNMIEDLVSHGYYCIAPNMRGYSSNARPKGKKNYAIKHLVNDVLGIAKSANKKQFHLVGHDWGSAIGWQVVHDYPDLIASWTGISVPHPQSFFEAILNDPDQQKRSKYIRLFQLPILPELKIKSKDFKLLRDLWNEQSEDEIENYIAILKEPGALTAMLNYYRAGYKTIKRARSEQVLGDIKVPTLFIWGNKDIAVGPVSVEGGHMYMNGDYTFLELNGGHWLIQTHYLEVKEAIVEHLKKFKVVDKIN